MIILFDHGLCARTQQTLNRHVENTRSQFDKLALKLNTYHLKNREGIEKACKASCGKTIHRLFQLWNPQRTSHHLQKQTRGRSSKNGDEKVAVTTIISLSGWSFIKSTSIRLFGDAAIIRWLPIKMISPTKKPCSLTKTNTKMSHQSQSQSSLDLEPIYLQTPKELKPCSFCLKLLCKWRYSSNAVLEKR